MVRETHGRNGESCVSARYLNDCYKFCRRSKGELENFYNHRRISTVSGR